MTMFICLQPNLKSGAFLKSLSVYIYLLQFQKKQSSSASSSASASGTSQSGLGADNGRTDSKDKLKLVNGESKL